MSEYARVLDVHEVAAFRAFLVKVAEGARNGIAAGDAEVRDMNRWLSQEQPQVWSRRIKLLQRKLEDAKQQLQSKQNTPTPTGEPPNTMFERKAVRVAKERLEAANERARKTKLWANRFEREEGNYRGGTNGARTAAQSTIPHAIRTLDELLGHLEDYMRLTSNIAVTDNTKRDDAEESVSRPTEQHEPAEPGVAPEPPKGTES